MGKGRSIIAVIAIVLGSWFIFGRGSDYTYSLWESILYLVVFPAVLVVALSALQERRKK